MAELKNRKTLAVALIVLIGVGSFAYLRLTGGTAGGLPASVLTISSPAQTSTFVTEYPVGGADSQPNAIAADSKGDVWFTLGADYALGELTPSTGVTHEFHVPGEIGTLVSWGVAVDDSKDLVWFTDQLGNAVWKFDVSAQAFTKYPLPSQHSSPYQVALSPGGIPWFTEIDAGKIGEVTPQGVVQEYSVLPSFSTGPSTTLTGPAGIAVGKGGQIWFTEVYADEVVSYSNGVFTQYPVTGGSSPTGIALDSAGNLWVTLHGGSDIAEVDPATNSTRIISTSVPSGVRSTLPYFVAVDQHDDVWFDEHYGNAIARYTPSNGTLVEYEIPTKVTSLGNISGAYTIGLDQSGHPWFTEFYSGKVGTVAQNGALGVQISVSPPSGENIYTIPKGANSSVALRVQSSSPSTLRDFPAGFGLTVSFSPSAGGGPYSSTMTILNTGSNGGASSFAVTVSVVTAQVVCSQVIEVSA